MVIKKGSLVIVAERARYIKLRDTGIIEVHFSGSREFIDGYADMPAAQVDFDLIVAAYAAGQTYLDLDA